MKVYQQATTGKLHKRRNCSITSRTRYDHFEVEFTDAYANCERCSKCWDGFKPAAKEFRNSNLDAFLRASYATEGGFGPEEKSALAKQFPLESGMSLEIEQGGRWLKTDSWIFRSWSGARRVNGRTYNGPVFVLGTGTEA